MNHHLDPDQVRTLAGYREQQARRDIDRQFAADEEASAVVEDLDVTANVWRALARRAAADLGRKVRTGFSADREEVWAQLVTPPRTMPASRLHRCGWIVHTNHRLAGSVEPEDSWTGDDAS
ncbi:hypothetical protein HMPREF0063_10218 [Aeromicrobium marinum DSM 15272]|uniref:Uncharacterized protein n=1 Tax=Aeromicrobium marinum DSM 15272 TaxID=585531 RepID=E2S861_9ACTN|nr:hypothetical protein [Aeromicrobium marinum]EFQ84366.1 hypothetical protein HMPREF0063_10218 [Aeromicrobium marinum DSM 15272]